MVKDLGYVFEVKNASMVIRFTLYGAITDERIQKERLIAQHRLVQLTK